MGQIKANRVAKLSKISRYHRTFSARCADIPDQLWDELTARQIAKIIDGPMEDSYKAGAAA